MTLYAQYDERELLARIAEGDEKAFRIIYERYWNNIYSQALHFLNSSIAAQDIVQEVFIKLWDKRTSLPEVKDVRSYLFITARNTLINSLRGRIPHQALQDNDQAAVQENLWVPDRQLSVKETAAIIHEAIEQLPSRQKQVYRMAREQGLPLKDIAGKMDITYNTAREHMANALANIRKYLKKYFGKLSILLLLFIHF